MIYHFFNLRKQMKRFLILGCTFLGVSSWLLTTVQAEDNGLIYLDLKDGTVVIQTFPDAAPLHVRQITDLTNKKFYDGVVFHRVIEGFMAQTGDPTGTGTGGSGRRLKAEFSEISHRRGVVSMARAQDPNSADSQFFIMLEDSPYLDGQYTVWGEVIEGMEYVDNIKKGSTHENGIVKNPDRIIRMYTKSE